MNPNAKTGSKGATVYSMENGKVEATDQRIEADTPVQTGLTYEGAFDGNGLPVGEQFRYFECQLPDGREVWLSQADLQPLEPAMA